MHPAETRDKVSGGARLFFPVGRQTFNRLLVICSSFVMDDYKF
jgi:hypothetical protein